MKKFLATRRRRVVAAAAPLALVASVAFAAWLTDGIGPGTTQGGKLEKLVVTQTALAPDATKCFPGQQCDATFQVDNPNAQTLKLTSATPSGSAWPGNWPTGCNPDVYLTPQSVTLATPIDVLSGPNTITIKNAYRMAANAPDECQGGNFVHDFRLVASQ